MKTLKKIISSILIVSVAMVFLISFTSCNTTKHFKKDTAFAIESVKVMDIPIAMFLKKDDSGITFRKDGTMTLRFALNSAIPSLVNKSFNISTMLGTMDFNEYMRVYVSPIFPGFSLYDIPTSLQLIDSSLGIRITGLDYSSPNTQALLEGIKTGVFADDIVFPSDIGVEYNGPYTIKHLKDSEGVDYTAIYMGKYEDDSESFVVMGLDANEGGKMTVSCSILFLEFSLNAIEI